MILQSRWLSKIFAGSGLAAVAILTLSQPSHGQERFSCHEEELLTTVQTERGKIPFIKWTNRSFPPPYSPTERCKIVSQRFQTFHRNGTLKYLKSDSLNNLPILCVAAYKGGSCLPNGLLVTFTPGTDANQALVRMLDRRVWAAEGALEFCDGCNSDPLVSEVNGQTYFNMENFLLWGDTP